MAEIKVLRVWLVRVIVLLQEAPAKILGCWPAMQETAYVFLINIKRCHLCLNYYITFGVPTLGLLLTKYSAENTKYIDVSGRPLFADIFA